MSEYPSVQPEYQQSVEKIKTDIQAVYQSLYDIRAWALREDRDDVVVNSPLMELIEKFETSAPSLLPEIQTNHGPHYFDKPQLDVVFKKANEILKSLQ